MEAMKEKMRGPEVAEEPVGAETAEEAVSRIFGVEPQTAASASRMKASARPEKTGAAANAELVAEPKPEPPRAETATARRSIAPAAELVSAIVQRIRGRIAKTAEKVPDLSIDVPVSIEDVINRARVPVELPEGETLRISIPAGTTDGQTIRLKEQGYRVTGMARGDVVATLRIGQDGPFRTRRLDLVTTLPLDLENAVLGCETMIETPNGPVAVTVPAWSGSDKVIRVPGKGLPGPTANAGTCSSNCGLCFMRSRMTR